MTTPKIKLIYTLFSFCLVAGLMACNKKEEAPFAGFQKPAHFPQPAYKFDNNPVTQDGFELGKKLFYDAGLSANGTISCENCHIQSAAFTAHGHSVSHGIFDRLGTRNSPPIMNLAWNTSFMWDGGIFDLDLQPLAPLTDHVEMDNTMENVLAYLKSNSSYPSLFKKAFNTDEITTPYLLKALSQFMVMCVSATSKYDSVKQNQATFTQKELAGRNK